MIKIAASTLFKFPVPAKQLIKSATTIVNTAQSTRMASSTASAVKINSVIFDYDGIIVDSETIYNDVNSKTMEHFGGQYSLELKQGEMGMKLSQAIEYVLEHSGLGANGVTYQQYFDYYEALVNQELPKCEMMPGARRLIEHLLRQNVPVAICTSSRSSEFPKKSGKCQDLISRMKPVVLAGDDPEVENGKPAPDPYNVTLRRMTPPPVADSVLVFEDSINGVKSALAAGCRVIWVPQLKFWENGQRDIDKAEEPFKTSTRYLGCIDTLVEFRPEDYGLPRMDDDGTE